MQPARLGFGTPTCFNASLYDVEGKATIPRTEGLVPFRSPLPYDQITSDNHCCLKGGRGTITIHTPHRGTASRIKTDATGKLAIPNGLFLNQGPRLLLRQHHQVIARISPLTALPDCNWPK
jgi:hypothetical protein